MSAETRPGAAACTTKGWFAAHKWLILRRLSQFSVIGLFLLGPLAGIWFIKGNLASSLILDTVPLSDPFVLLQTMFAGHLPETTALTGAAIVLVAYALVGGRAYCSWVCPVNVVTDVAAWARRRLDLRGGVRINRRTRYWVLAMVPVAAVATGVIAWELVNPVTLTFRAIVFGAGAAWMVVLAVFLYDLFVAERGWCGHLCPMGAFYSIVGTVSLVRVSARDRGACDSCMDCYAICPEPQVLSPAVRGGETGAGPVVLSPNCTNCGRCIDVCAPDVFAFTTRFNTEVDDGDKAQPEVMRKAA